LLRTLQRLAPAGWAVSKPPLCVFWQAPGLQSRMQPDMLLRHPAHGTLVLDAKWKRPHGKPAEADLRQLFAYAQHFGATRARLLYPQSGSEASVEGAFVPKLYDAEAKQALTIQGGVSYLRVGRGPGLPAAEDPDVAPDGYLRNTLATEMEAWLRPPRA
jgi:5-methylcytosine-specific restriction enzyme subunit McrC